jgi:ring-1,2-phenylacetyl-CoA epoxidase subunit PaaD
VVTPGARHVALGLVPAAPMAVREALVRSILRGVVDPEIPTVSIVDLGLVHRVEVGDTVRVELLPTFVACPALEVIQAAVTDALRVLGRQIEVTFTFEVPWTTDRLTDAGRAGLRKAGIAPPADRASVRCPFCDSARVAMSSAFGPTLCRSLFYCRACRQPFEAFKPV